ncbi:MAG: 50S ribosomal protein L25/general stress protein Ctc [Gammaproteobacteria bacterium]|nr:50S ribosomal protein L25/general stress protein Ctc [Gammaproteobacteria bacterium]
MSVSKTKSAEVVLTASARDDMGKGASRRLRRSGMVPAIVYGGKEAPATITLEQRELQKEMKQESFYSKILTLKIGNNSEKVILKDLHRHPYKPIIMHMDLVRVSADKELTVHVPIHYLNEATAKGVKAGGVVSHNMIDIEVCCLPANLPEFVEIDLANLDLDEIIHLSQIKLPEGVTSVALNHEDDKVVAAIHLPKVMSAEDEAAPAAEATPTEDNKDN